MGRVFFLSIVGVEPKKVPINGGPAITLCETSAAAGAAWDDNDPIVFAGRRTGMSGTWVGSKLYRVSANGASLPH